MRTVFRILIPGGLILGAALGTVYLADVDAGLGLITGRYAVVLYGVGAILAAVFHRSRVVAILVGFGFVDFFRVAAIAGGPDPFVPLATLLMGLIGVLALFRDRGITSRGGVLQLVAGAAVAAAAAVAARAPDRFTSAWEEWQLLPVGLRGAIDLPQATVAIGAGALVLGLYGAYRWRGPIERALLFSLLATAATFLPGLSPPESSFLLMCAGLVLSISVLETSYFMAYRDELTRLPGRRALMHDLDDVGSTFTIAMVDVDHFKQFNDKHGHDVGDQVLQLVAKHLAVGPGGGKAYRYGGEEFTLVYPGRVRDDALPHADAVREAVAAASFSLRAWNRPRKKPQGAKRKKKQKRAKKLSVTVSIGLADSTGKSGEPADVLKNADQALYRAKRDGRNRVAT